MREDREMKGRSWPLKFNFRKKRRGIDFTDLGKRDLSPFSLRTTLPSPPLARNSERTKRELPCSQFKQGNGRLQHRGRQASVGSRHQRMAMPFSDIN